ncbi:hypothetical protein IMG5_206721 [Ichthyophthirius multifiliis]|uniref:Histidine acid phosphatase family protein n=1 Tax=Ichthyophthirius multifiliis TaxID=5932 RepID=G0R6N6_ICHMU|nr:hypothetical protein IMG5_206721 [Ichthyophthirius multifiliis]EGR26872.1 hypothetical protein IMG5_206721 [Ichthyophthirius multifiliis]|eukprot:XP_004023756.1 hypothetical protein IMG5_206721 [Ichthyophthirius multifiliis]
MVQIAMRHGARYSVNSKVIKDKPDYKFYKQKEGQLTSVGMLQHYNFGNLVRQEYVGEKRFLPENYDIDSIYAFSSNVNRTLQSLQSFLYGLYPLRTGIALPQNLADNLKEAPYHQNQQQQRAQQVNDFVYNNNLRFALPEGFYPYVIQQYNDELNILKFKCKPSKSKFKAENLQKNIVMLEQFYKKYENQVNQIAAKVGISYTLDVKNISAFVDWVTTSRFLAFIRLLHISLLQQEVNFNSIYQIPFRRI